MNKDLKKSIANTANRIRKAHGLPELSLAFWEEDLHPRGEHGRFATKASKGYRDSVRDVGTYHTPPSSRYGEFEGRTYDREQVQREMRERNNAESTPSKSRLQDLLEGVGIMAAGHYLPAVANTVAGLVSGGGVAAETGFISGLAKGALTALHIIPAGAVLSPGMSLLVGIAAGVLTAYGTYRVLKAIISGTAYVTAKYGTKATIGVGKMVAEPFAEAGRGIYEGATA